MTLRKSKIVRGFPIPAHECTLIFMEANSLYLPLCMPHSHKHTPLSRLQAESTVVNIHEIIIINVTKVILFLLQERLVLIPRNGSTVREMAALRQPSWSNSVHFTFEIEIIWLGILNHTHPIIKFNRQRFPTLVQRTTSLGTQFLEYGRSIHWLLHSFLRAKTKQNI